MAITIEAVYENGILRPVQPLPLAENEKVKVTVHIALSIAEQTAGMIKWPGDPDVVRRIAENDEFGIVESP